MQEYSEVLKQESKTMRDITKREYQKKSGPSAQNTLPDRSDPAKHKRLLYETGAFVEKLSTDNLKVVS